MRPSSLMLVFAAALTAGIAYAQDAHAMDTTRQKCVASEGSLTSGGQLRMINATHFVILPKLQETAIIITTNADPTDRTSYIWQVPDAHQPISESNQACIKKTLKQSDISFNSRRPPSVITNQFNEDLAHKQCDASNALNMTTKDSCKFLGDAFQKLYAHGGRVLLWGTNEDNNLMIVEGSVDSAGSPVVGETTGPGSILNASIAGAVTVELPLSNVETTDEFRQALIKQKRTP